MAGDRLPCPVNISGTSARDGAHAYAIVNFGSLSLAGAEDSQKAFAKEVTACRNALLLTDPHDDREILKSTKGTRVAGTCEWITQNESYQSWLDGGTRLLWISGGPGKGKTMLSIFLTEELERITQAMEDVELLFYFCSHQDEKRNTAVAVLRGLVYQIITKRPNLAKHVLSSFESPKKAQATLSSLEALWIIFKKLVQDPDLGTAFCVLDGLDECDEDTLRVLVPKIIGMFSQKDSPPTTKEFRLVIISRDIRGLQSCTQVKLDPDNEGRVSSDIERFVSDRIEELSGIEGFNDEIRATVQKLLLERSQGTFLWVGFVMNQLSQDRTCTEVLKTLETLPSGLPAMYSRMLLQIKSEHRRTTSMILRWVTMVSRPLLLQELAAAVGVRSSSTLITIERAIRDKITLCGPFLKIQEQRVELIHQSARDYLLQKEPHNNQDLEEFRIKPEEAHLELARTCLNCISHSVLQDAPIDLHDSSFSQKSPLLQYASIHWPEHARWCSTLAAELFDVSKPVFQNNSLLKNWSESYRRAGLWPTPSTLPLHTACYLGIVPWIKAQLRKKSWVPMFPKVVDQKDEYGWTALYQAALGGHKEAVKLLIDGRADVNAKNNHGWTALYRAAKEGNEAVVQLLVDSGADVNAKDTDEETALHCAAKGGHEVVVRLLLEKGADFESKDDSYRTPLFWATEERHEAVVKLLLEKGANLKSKDKYGQTPLSRAAVNGHEAVVKLLLEKGADLESKDEFGQTPLSWAVKSGDEAVVKLLLKNSVDLEPKDEYGQSLLSRAAGSGNEAVVKLLLENGPDLESRDKHGLTPLSWAAENGHEAVVKLLLEKGADLESKDDQGRKPLLWAVKGGNVAVVKLLLKNSAGLESKNEYGQTLLSWAAEYRHEAVVKLLLEKGADPESKDKYGQTLLSWAAVNGNEAVVELLLEKGADLESKDEYDRTLLSQAARNGNEAVVKLLLEKGVDLESKDMLGQTPLSWAAEYGHEAVVKLLLEKGADPESKDKYGHTLLSWAARNGSEAVVKLLLEKGANPESKDKYGQAPLFWAAENGHQAIVKLLLEKGADANTKGIHNFY